MICGMPSFICIGCERVVISRQYMVKAFFFLRNYCLPYVIFSVVYPWSVCESIVSAAVAPVGFGYTICNVSGCAPTLPVTLIHHPTGTPSV